MNNKMHTEGVVIHWHGIRQCHRLELATGFLATPKTGKHEEDFIFEQEKLKFGTPWADGTASISQCAVNPGETFVYKFVADKPGTYFYHGHFGMQRAAGLYGSLIVLDSPEQPEPFRHQYDDGGELPMMLLSDWWHQNVYAQAAGLDGKDRHFEWIGEPQTILINGRGQFECTLGPARKSFEKLLNENVETCVDDQKMCSDQEKCLRRSECGPYCPRSQCAPVVFNVEQGKTYRLRIASTTSLSLLNVKIQGHKMTVVEADGNHVEPFVVDDIDIYSGESYSVLLKADQKPASYWISVGVRGRHPKTVPALAILSYGNGNAAPPPLQLPAGEPPVTPAWNDTQRSKAFTYSIRARKDTNRPPPAAADRQIVLLNTQNLMDGRYRWSINNNANMLREEVSETHPWHLHGHDFWVLGYGDGRYDPAAHAAGLNAADPPLRNTAVVFPHGWTALRFVANNTGAWAFHCHIEPHLHMGMGVVFVEGEDRMHELDVPKDAMACGLVARTAATPLTPATPLPPSPAPAP
ncbi:hypothetical protein OsI_23413 [Oryza sativa Indica Group]|uniref:L-ascorbate oxidase n=1 Tax=Oryza sativa subsp. indica TaxID=39946 RepID=A2YE69_ORYSI|nr:hypothetical protein OsI_23413 [Oryza sativa Indica Group]